MYNIIEERPKEEKSLLVNEKSEQEESGREKERALCMKEREREKENHKAIEETSSKNCRE